MRLRPRILLLSALALLAFRLDTAATQHAEPVRLVVQNETYSSLQVSMVDAAGRETRLGQAPPEFSNTLLAREPLPPQPVRFLARLVGESEFLYRSDPVQLRSGMRLRWRLPQNTIEN